MRAETGTRTGYVPNKNPLKDTEGFEDLDNYWSAEKPKVQEVNPVKKIKQPLPSEYEKVSPSKVLKPVNKVKQPVVESSEEEEEVLKSSNKINRRFSVDSWEKPSKVKTFETKNLDGFDDSEESDDSMVLKDLLAKKRNFQKPSPKASPLGRNMSAKRVSFSNSKSAINIARNFTSISRAPHEKKLSPVVRELDNREIVSPATFLSKRNEQPKSSLKSSLKSCKKGMRLSSPGTVGSFKTLPVEEQDDPIVESSHVPSPTYNTPVQSEMSEDEEVAMQSPLSHGSNPESNGYQSDNSDDGGRKQKRRQPSLSSSDSDSDEPPTTYKSVDRARNRTIAPLFDPEEYDCTPGVRRSKRRRWLPLAHWKGERLLMEKDGAIDAPSVVAAVKPDLFKTPAAPSKRRSTKTQRRKPKAETKAASSWIPGDEILDDYHSTIVQQDPETGEEEHLVIVRCGEDISTTTLPQDPSVQFINPSNKKEMVEASAGAAGASFEDETFISGVVLLPPLAVKATENASKFKQIFFVQEAADKSLVVQINECRYPLARGDHFWVPTNTDYSMTNYSCSEPATITFVLLKPVEL